MKRLAKQTPQIKALARTASRETVKLFSSRILRPGIGLVLVPAPQSTPGRFYQIKWGDTLFGITQRAYGRELNGKSPAHQRFSIQPPVLEGRSGVRRKIFPDGRISVSPGCVGDVRVQMESVNTASSGKSFPMIWIPAEDGLEPF